MTDKTEQAVKELVRMSAEIQRGKCRLTERDKDCDTASEYMIDRYFAFDSVYECSCGALFGHVAEKRPRFCPSCGARIVEVVTS